MTLFFRDRFFGLAGVLAWLMIALAARSGAAQQDRFPSRYQYPVSQYPARRVQFREPASQPRGDEFQQRQQQRVGPQPVVRQHPLVPAIAMAHRSMKAMEGIRDYECTLVKRHRNRETGKMRDLQYIQLRVRHKPFSVYMYFLTPADTKGQQVLYVEGANKDSAGKSNLVVQPVGFVKGRLGPFHFSPQSPTVMKDQRYPITDVGFKNLAVRLIEVAERDKKFGECDVKFFNKTMVNNRSTTCIQVYHPVPRDNFRFHIAKIFIDDELGVPIRYEAYMWPKKPGGKPVLDEEYTYLNVKTNLGLTDADFVIRKNK